MPPMGRFPVHDVLSLHGRRDNYSLHGFHTWLDVIYRFLLHSCSSPLSGRLGRPLRHSAISARVRNLITAATMMRPIFTAHRHNAPGWRWWRSLRFVGGFAMATRRSRPLGGSSGMPTDRAVGLSGASTTVKWCGVSVWRLRFACRGGLRKHCPVTPRTPYPWGFDLCTAGART